MCCLDDRAEKQIPRFALNDKFGPLNLRNDMLGAVELVKGGRWNGSRPTPPVFWMCGKCRTLSPLFLEVWQMLELAGDFSDVWQGKGLACDLPSHDYGRRGQEAQKSRDTVSAGEGGF